MKTINGMHPDAVAWFNWLESEEGKSSANPQTLFLPPKQGEFLKNRLWRAFMAGVKHGERKGSSFEPLDATVQNHQGGGA